MKGNPKHFHVAAHSLAALANPSALSGMGRRRTAEGSGLGPAPIGEQRTSDAQAAPSAAAALTSASPRARPMGSKSPHRPPESPCPPSSATAVTAASPRAVAVPLPIVAKPAASERDCGEQDGGVQNNHTLASAPSAATFVEAAASSVPVSSPVVVRLYASRLANRENTPPGSPSQDTWPRANRLMLPVVRSGSALAKARELRLSMQGALLKPDTGAMTPPAPAAVTPLKPANAAAAP